MKGENMSAWHTIYTKENILEKDAQEIINEFPDDWFSYGKNKRDEKPIKQEWGWFTIVDVWKPCVEDGNEYGLKTIGAWTIGGSGTTIVNFIEKKLNELGYTILDVTFSR